MTESRSASPEAKVIASLKRAILDRAVLDAVHDPQNGVRATAAQDIISRAHSVWDVSNDGSLAPRNGGAVLLGDDRISPMSLGEWIRSLRQASAHLFMDEDTRQVRHEVYGGRTRAEFEKLDPLSKLFVANGGW